MGHTRIECKHGVLITQCRCPSPEKAITLAPCPAHCKVERRSVPECPIDGCDLQHTAPIGVSIMRHYDREHIADRKARQAASEANMIAELRYFGKDNA